METHKPGTVFFRKFLSVGFGSALALILALAVAEHVIIRRSLIYEARHHAEEMAEGLSLSELSAIVSASREAGQLQVDPSDAAELDRKLSAFLEPFSILSVRLIDTRGLIVFSTDEDLIGQLSHHDSRPEEGLHVALAGETSVIFESHAHAKDLADRQQADLAIVETYIPIRGEDGVVLGAFELCTDVQAHLEAGFDTWVTLVGTICLLVFVSLLGLSLLVKRLCNHMDEAAEHEFAATLELTRSEKFLQHIMDSIPDDLLVIGADHTVLLANKSVREKYGADPVALTKKCFEIFHADENPCSGEDHGCPMRDSILTGTQASATHRHLDKDGREFYVEVVTVPIFDTNGQAVQFIEHCRDITERMRSDAEIHATNRKLQAVNESLGRAKTEAQTQARNAIEADAAKTVFLANMSHEMRTPLTAILGFADLIDDPDTTEAVAASNLSVIKRNGEHLLTLIEDILDLAKIEEGQMALRLAGCDTLAFVAEIASEVHPQAVASGLPFATNFLTAVPRMVFTDQSRLKQALLSLLGNAFKFTNKGNIGLEIEFNSGSGGQASTMSFHVKDTGIGISEDARRRLFQPFSQADDQFNRQFGGTGLGLVITRRIGEVLGGEVTVQSEPGVGSCFTLRIDVGDVSEQPLVTPPTMDTTRAKAPAKPQKTTIDLSGLEILYAEDMPDNQFLVGTILRKAGAKVEIAENGAIAVEKFEAAEYDLILMDIQMPEMDGLEATRIIRERGYIRPIVALTANTMENDRRLSAEAGCDQHLSKPVNRRLLLETVQSHCREAQLV